jgi:hypothetical protein
LSAPAEAFGVRKAVPFELIAHWRRSCAPWLERNPFSSSSGSWSSTGLSPAAGGGVSWSWLVCGGRVVV